MKTRDAVSAFGNANKLAKALGISRQAITKWGENVPEVRKYHIEAVARDLGIPMSSLSGGGRT